MNVLEKILEEVEEATFQEDAPIYSGDMEVDGYVRASKVEEIIRSNMDEVENGDRENGCKVYEVNKNVMKNVKPVSRDFINECEETSRKYKKNTGTV